MTRRRSAKDPVGELLVGLAGLGLLLGILGTVTGSSSSMVLAGILAATGIIGIIVIVPRRRAARRRFATTLDGFLALSPSEFEVEVGKVLEAGGFRHMRRVGGSGDLSVDVRGRDATGRAVLVQCKRYAPGRSVGSPAIQQFYGMCHFHDPSALAIFVTTASYTRDAMTVARKAGVRLIDGSELVELALRGRESRQGAGALVDAPVVAPRVGGGR